MLFAFFFGMIGLGFTVLWVLAIVEIIRSEFKDKTERIIWLLLVILLPFLGTVLYLMIGRRSRLSTNSEML